MSGIVSSNVLIMEIHGVS